jgi:hypothetical protein
MFQDGAEVARRGLRPLPMFCICLKVSEWSDVGMSVCIIYTVIVITLCRYPIVGVVGCCLQGVAIYWHKSLSGKYGFLCAAWVEHPLYGQHSNAGMPGCRFNSWQLDGHFVVNFLESVKRVGLRLK